MAVDLQLKYGAGTDWQDPDTNYHLYPPFAEQTLTVVMEKALAKAAQLLLNKGANPLYI